MNAVQVKGVEARKIYRATIRRTADDVELYYEWAFGCDLSMTISRLVYNFYNPNSSVYVDVTDSNGKEIDW